MLSFQQILNVKDDEFRSLLLDFYRIYPTDIDTELFNSNNDIGKDMRYKLALLLKKRIFNDKLMNAFNIDDKYKYKKKIEISDNLILTKSEDDYYYIFRQLVDGIAIFRDYDVLMDFIKNQKVEFSKEDFDKINSFILSESNKPYFDRRKSKYYPFIEERKRLKTLLDMGDSLYLISQDFTDLRNKTLGNVGEYFVDDFLNLKDRNPRFISKDIGDGPGYDHHYMLDNMEMLVETKTTTKDDDDDYFILTNNEYNIMLDCLDLDYRTYTVARAFIDKETINCRKIHMLRADTDKILSPLNYDMNCNYEYDHDEEYGKVFKKKIK